MPSDPTTKDLIEAAREQAELHLTTTRRLLTALADRLEITEEECDKQVGVIRKLRTRLEEVGEERDRWRDAAIQAKNDLRTIEAAFRDATPMGEDGPDPPIGPGHVFAAWTSPANTMRWIERMENGDPGSLEPEGGDADGTGVGEEASGREPDVTQGESGIARCTCGRGSPVPCRVHPPDSPEPSTPEPDRSDRGEERLNDLLDRALEGLRRREGEDVDAWAERLGRDIHRAAMEDPDPDTDDVPNRAESVDPEPEDDPWEAVERADGAPGIGWLDAALVTALLDLRKWVEALIEDQRQRDHAGSRAAEDLTRRVVALEAVAHEPATIPIGNIQARLSKLEEHAGRRVEDIEDLRDRVKHLTQVARDSHTRLSAIEKRPTVIPSDIQERVEVHGKHIEHLLRDVLRVMDRVDVLESHADRGSEAERELRENDRIALRARGTLRDDLEKIDDHTEALAERVERLEGWHQDILDRQHRILDLLVDPETGERRVLRLRVARGVVEDMEET